MKCKISHILPIKYNSGSIYLAVFQCLVLSQIQEVVMHHKIDFENFFSMNPILEVSLFNLHKNKPTVPQKLKFNMGINLSALRITW